MRPPLNAERLSQIEELYHLVLEQEPAGRTLFLAEASLQDEDLRNEVESLLAARPAEACFLDEPVMRQAAMIASHADSRSHRLASGNQLGPYTIEAALGSGGMGEVYRARDNRLSRTVALKVLPARSAAATDLRQRLAREAKVIASLNHPHICGLFDIGCDGEIDYLVMEYLEGDSLARRLSRGALPFPEALRVAIQVLDALAAAHAAGIVHRDLKPGNIVLTKSGAKLLDFGLAKAPAMTGGALPITTSGMLVGTVQYMSPEQLQGREADVRSDLFAFGAVLYEMLTGTRPFPGESQLSIANAILDKQPEPLHNLQAQTPPALERLVMKCLAKDLAARWQSTADLASELKWIAETDTAPAATYPHPASGGGHRLLYGALAAGLLILVIAGTAFYWRTSQTPSLLVAAEIAPPHNVRFNPADFGGEPALSPDGRMVAFGAADDSGKTMLWVRSVDSLSPRFIAGAEGARHPFWSADGRTLAFFAGGELKSVDAAGGPASDLAPASPFEGGGSANREGTIVFVPDVVRGVYKIPSSGGKPVPVVSAKTEHSYFSHPRFLPDGKHFLYVFSGSDAGAEGTYFASLDGRENRHVAASSNAIYAGGFLLYLRQATLMAQPFDAVRGKFKSQAARPVADHVAFNYFHNNFDASETGVLVYRARTEESDKRLTWFDRNGKPQGFTGEAADYWDVRLSPDGSSLVFNAGSPNSDVWVDELTRGVRTRLTIDPGTDHGVPVWSSDGTRIAFGILEGKNKNNIFQKAQNGAGAEERLIADTEKNIWPTSWSRDGKFLLYVRSDSLQERTEIWVLSVADQRSSAFIQNQARAYDGQFSADARWVAYVSDESGRSEVYVAPFEASAAHSRRWQISAAGGRSPRWRNDGRELFYLSPTNHMMAAEIQVRGNALTPRPAQALFRCIPIPSLPSSSPYDVSADGKKFVINSFSEDHTPLILVVNWARNLPKP